MALWNDVRVRNALSVGHLQKKMLFEIIPDVFPGGFMSELESQLWIKFHNNLEDKKRG